MLALTRHLAALAALAALACTSSPTGSEPAMGWTGVLDEASFAALHELREDAPPTPLHGEDISIDGARAYLSLPPGSAAPLPAVLLIHEWWGLNDHIRHWADRLAADGYAALAVDLYGGQTATTREEAGALMQGVDQEVARATLLRAHRFLAEDPRMRATRRACFGWCFGGGWSLQLALAATDLDAAVVYYGRLVTDPDALRAIRAPLLGVFGNRDRGIPPAAVDAFEAAMTAAGREVRILRYDADHAFANPSSARYDTANAAAAWAEVRSFLAAKLR